MPAPSDPTHTVEVTCPGCFHPQQWDANGACPVCHHRINAEGRSGALLPVGTQLKGYVIGEKLGQGGFGITYRGFDLTLKMKVAIKEYYPSELVGRSTDRKTVVLNGHDHEELFRYGLRTFLQEAQTVAQLRHPHLVRVLNYFELNDTAYLVMDYYEGEDLSKHLKPPKGQRRIQMPWRRAVKLLLPVLDGLQKVHRAGFMHRDIKPGNLYLTKDDELILLDFGSARQVSGTHSHSLLIFSEGYAPYEQYLQGQLTRQGPWTDVYATAATLYFMLTGSQPPSALLRKEAAQSRQPELLKPAQHFVPDLPPMFDTVLRRALTVEPEQRLPSIVAFRQQLGAVAAAEEKRAVEALSKSEITSEEIAKPSQPVGKVVVDRSPRFNLQAAVISLAVTGLAWGGWWIGFRTPERPNSPVVSVAVTPPPAVDAPPVAKPVPTTLPVKPAPVAPVAATLLIAAPAPVTKPNPPTPLPLVASTQDEDGSDAIPREVQAPIAPPRFTDNSDGTVTDNQSGLIWLKNANCFGYKNWSTAMDLAKQLKNGQCGLRDRSVAGQWRLPSKEEWEAFNIDENPGGPALTAGHPFTGIQSDYYWSSTTYAGGSRSAPLSLTPC